MLKYEIDQAHTHLGFTAKHLAVSTVRGLFNKFEGEFESPDDDYTKARGEVKIEVTSLESRSDQRDTHLRSADFFDAEKYPYLTFKLTGIEPVDEENFRVKGELTIKDVTKAVAFELEVSGFGPDAYGGTRCGFSATTQINRHDFHVDFNGPIPGVPGGVAVSENVTITIEIEGVLQA